MALDLFTVRTVAAPEVSAGPATATCLARVVVLRLGKIGLLGMRPSGVLVSRHGDVSRTPIRDVTRRAQAGIALTAVLCAWGLSVGAARRRERSHDGQIR